ncbi:carboxymuconolactone decarboxylase family protein [Actinomadura nitritigenes]|uniref:carboxymuconolactone decarboxylase family protein n=1 Tax=Actinomadura nitritigenes TaxID=134602 RepID=UPI003D8FD5C7
MNRLLSRATRRAARTHVRHVGVVAPAAADGLVARVYAQLEHDFGMFAPPVVVHSAAPALLAACWTMLRETLLARGRADRAAKERVAVAVSLANTCPYCVDVHGAALHALSADRGAGRAGRGGDVRDARVRDVERWVRGASSHPGKAEPELLGVALTFHYLNRVVNVFLTESPFPAGTPDRLRGSLRSLVGQMLHRQVRRSLPPGASLELLPDAAPLPADLAWAAGSPHVGGALARAAAAFEEAGRRWVPERVRELLLTDLARQDGEDGQDGGGGGPGRAWAGEAAAALPAAERAAGRLALLTARASYQVLPVDVRAYRDTAEDDAAVVGMVAWAAFTAARRSAARLGGAPAAGR